MHEEEGGFYYYIGTKNYQNKILQINNLLYKTKIGQSDFKYGLESALGDRLKTRQLYKDEYYYNKNGVINKTIEHNGIVTEKVFNENEVEN